jgi:hypothetical protein
MKIKKQHIYFPVLLTAFLILHSAYLFSQDIHFSNWQMSPLNTSPANAGLFEGEGRLIFNYRNQWKAVPVPYNTFSFGADFNLQKSLIKGTHEALGLMFNHDAAGDGKYQINELKVPINHKFTFKKDTGLTLALGVLAGITNISISPNRLSYDRQWEGVAYKWGLGKCENF